MTAPSSSCLNRANRAALSGDQFAARKQQALVVLLAQQLADAQFVRADQRGSDRLWQEAAALEIDPERLTALLYGGEDPHNREALRQQDEAWLAAQPVASRGWGLQRLHRNRGRRPVRPLTRAT